MADLAGQGVLISLEPGRHDEPETDRVPNQWLDRPARLDGDGVTGPELVRGTVDPPAIHGHVTVAHELPRLGSGPGESKPVDGVVEAKLELAQQRFPSCLRLPAAGLDVAPELPGGHPVEPLQLLLLFELQQVVRIALPAAALLQPALLARRIWPPDAAALAGNLAGALEAELDAGAALEFFERSTRSHAAPIPLYMPASNRGPRHPPPPQAGEGRGGSLRNLHLHRDFGRDRDRFIERSMALVVLD